MPTLIEEKGLEETIKLCKELGLEFVELNMNLPQYQLEQLEKTKELKVLQDKYQIYYTIHLDENLNICDFNPLVARAYMETVEKVIDMGKELKIPIINMHMNHGVHFTLPEKKIQLFQEYKDTYLESIISFREMCVKGIGEENICICIENTDGFTEYEKAAIELLLESPVFGLTWDIGHSYSCNDQDKSFIMKHQEKLRHFHIHDGKGNANHMTLGTGEIMVLDFLDLAKQHECRCVIETKTIAALRESVKWLEEEFLPLVELREQTQTTGY